jgi:5-methylthioadenosine/S-adenosylhomocysteine deaminase
MALASSVPIVETAPVDLRITGALVVTVAGPELDGGVVEITGDRITHVGLAATAAPAREAVDARDRIVVPGFVNAHCHLSQQLGRGLADDVDLVTWLHDRIWPYEQALTPDDVEISALACAIEQIRSGTTLVADPGGQHVDAAGRAIDRAGIRAVLARSTMDEGEGLPPGWAEGTDDALATQHALVDRWHGAADGRLRASYCLRTIFNCSDELIVGSVAAARERGVIVQMHVAEIPAENDHVRATRGTSTVRHLDALGALGPHLLGAHCVWIDDHEVQLLARSGTGIAHCVGSNLRILGIPRIADLVDAGAVVGIGTDGAPSNNRMSVIDEMWAAGMVQQGLRLDPTALPARRVLRMATLDGARAVGWGDELGSIEVGKRADLVVIDPLTPNMATAHDLVAAVVTSMTAANVESVLCAGRWVLRDRAVTTVDERAVLVEARDRARAVAVRAGIRTELRVP